ncbi:unnamed protein product, partial [Rotaria sordida]
LSYFRQISPHATIFNTSSLGKKDSDNIPVRQWLKQRENLSTFVYELCKTSDLCCENKENNTFITQIEPTLTQPQQDSSSSTIPMVTLTPQTQSIKFSDQVRRAKILWAMNAPYHGYSYLSCNESGDLFKMIFLDSKITQEFKMKQTELSHMISHDLGPFFTRDLLQDIKQCEGFVLCSDEQKNHQNNKQLDLFLKYWSIEMQDVVICYYKSVLLDHASAYTIRDCIVDSFRIDGIDIKHLSMIERDNPNVNKTVEKLIDAELKQVDE